MLDWVDDYCKAWGRCTRWILADTDEGYPSRDNITRAKEGFMDAKAQRGLMQHFGEVRLEQALAVSRAMKHPTPMPEDGLAVLWAQYVPKARSKVRAHNVSAYLGREMSHADYWRRLDSAHWFLAARIAPESNPKVVETRLSLNLETGTST